MTINLKLFYKIAFWFSFIGLVAIISDFGFSQTEKSKRILDGFYFIVLTMGVTSTALRYFKDKQIKKNKVLAFDLLSVAFTLLGILYVLVCWCTF
jgi:trk system potassium uptake protein